MTPGANVNRRNPYVVPLLALGVATAIGGVIGGLVAKAFADHAPLATSSMMTLPVYTYTQYTERSIGPDYTGLGIGILVAVLGVIILSAGVIVAFTKPRVA
jgi:hypothetical protein